MPRFNPEEYEPVENRIERFWEKYPDKGSITTHLIHHSETQYIVRAEVSNYDHVLGTGLAEELIGKRGVNETNALENCETSAIGRALANAGFSPKAGKRPSREEMDKADRTRSSLNDAAAARDELRQWAAESGTPLMALVNAYKTVSPDVPLHKDTNAERIRSFLALLKLDPKAVLNATTEEEGVKQE